MIMKRTKIEFRDEDDHGHLENVETIHGKDSDMASDTSVPEVRKWLWGQLEEPKTVSDLEGSDRDGGRGFIGEFGVESLVILARALEEMRMDDLLYSFGVDGEVEWGRM